MREIAKLLVDHVALQALLDLLEGLLRDRRSPVVVSELLHCAPDVVGHVVEHRLAEAGIVRRVREQRAPFGFESFVEQVAQVLEQTIHATGILEFTATLSDLPCHLLQSPAALGAFAHEVAQGLGDRLAAQDPLGQLVDPDARISRRRERVGTPVEGAVAKAAHRSPGSGAAVATDTADGVLVDAPGQPQALDGVLDAGRHQAGRLGHIGLEDPRESTEPVERTELGEQRRCGNRVARHQRVASSNQATSAVSVGRDLVATELSAPGLGGRAAREQLQRLLLPAFLTDVELDLSAKSRHDPREISNTRHGVGLATESGAANCGAGECSTQAIANRADTPLRWSTADEPRTSRVKRATISSRCRGTTASMRASCLISSISASRLTG